MSELPPAFTGAQPPAGEAEAAGPLETRSRSPVRSGEPAAERWDSEWWVVAGVSVVVVMLSAVLSVVRLVHMGTSITFDLGNYEYYSGYAAIHGFRGPVALPGQLETYLDSQMNVVYYLLITHLPPLRALETVAALQSLPVSLLALLVWRVARTTTGSSVLPPFAGLAVGVAAFYSPLFGIELGQTSSDVLLGTLLFVAAALLYSTLTAAADGRASFGLAALAGLLLGLAGELKFTELAFGLALFVGFAVALLLTRARAGWTHRRCLALTTTVAVPAVVTTVALYLPMGFMLWHRYQDPLFPYFNGIFHSRYLRPGDFTDGYAAKSPASLWRHFRLLIGGHSRQNGLFGSRVDSPVLFFGLVIIALLLAFDLYKRDKPRAVFLEISFLLGFLLWAVVLGFYRYLAPLEMATAAVVIMLVLLHRFHRAATLAVVAGAIAVSAIYLHSPVLGVRKDFGGSFFSVPAHAFRGFRQDGMVLAGGAALGYLVPDMPANTFLVRAGGNLEEVVSAAWWAHVRHVVDHSHRSWWVMFSTATKPAVVSRDLRRVGFPGSFHSCLTVHTGLADVKICRAAPPSPPASR